MTVATQKLSVPSLLAHPAEKGCPRKRRGRAGQMRRGRRKKTPGRERGTVRETWEKLERMKGEAARWWCGGVVGGVPGVHNTAVSGGPTVQ